MGTVEKILILITFIVLCFASGCDFVAPNVSKAQTERKQASLQEQELEQLKRIADSLEIIASPPLTK